MDLTARIEQDYIAAYKAQGALRAESQGVLSAESTEVLRLGVLRLLKAAAKNQQVEFRRPLTDEELATVIQKQAKQRQDSIEQYTAANRLDLAAKEAAELVILQEYLPEPLSAAQLDEAIALALAETQVTAMSGMGKVIQAVMTACKGRVDGKAVSAAVRNKLQSLQ